jgi:hypothetical protein
MQVAPRAASDQRGAHAGARRGEHVVVQAVTDVENVLFGHSGHLCHLVVEGGVGLFHTPLGAGEHLVHGQIHPHEGRLRLRRLVSGDDHLEAAPAQFGQRRAHVGIEVIRVEVLAQAVGVVLAPAGDLVFDVDAGPHDLERVAVMPVEGGHPAEYPEKGQARHAEAVRPAAPDPSLVNERLADVEYHRLDHPVRIAGV